MNKTDRQITNSFSEADRKENLRRLSEVAKLMLDAGLLGIFAFISPYEEERQLVKNIIGEDRYLQVYVNASLEVCEQRDPKGLYAKARQGLIPFFTGISSPYERPLTSNLEVKTAEETIEESLLKIIHFVEPLLKLQEDRPAVSTTPA